jgi:hypothetical protein
MDTQVNGGTDYSVFEGRIFKGGKTADGHLWAVTGYTYYLSAMRAWVEKREGDPPEMDDTTLILITPEGVVRQWESKGWSEIQAEYYAWGSGQQFALGAMAAGANADEAVEAACRHDPWSSEPLLVEVLGETLEAAEPIVGTVQVEDPGPQPRPDWRESMGLK